MRYCRYCGESMKDDVSFCPSCGKSVANPVQNSNGEGTVHIKTGEELVKDADKIKWMGINACVLMILQIWMPYIKYRSRLPMNTWYLTSEDGLELVWVPWLILVTAIASLVLFVNKMNIPALVVNFIYCMVTMIPLFGLIGEEMEGWFFSTGFLVNIVALAVFIDNAVKQLKIERYQKSLGA